MFQIIPDDDQLQIVDAVSRFAAEELPLSRLRAPADTADLWRRVAEQGYLTLALPEAAGGAGFTLAEEVLVFRELGRAAFSPSAAAATVAAHLLAEEGDLTRVAAIGSGELGVAAALRRAAGLLLVDADDASLILVAEGDSLALVPRAALGPYMPTASLDDAVSLATTPPCDPAILALVPRPALARRLRLLLAAMHCGIAERARDMAVDYASQRVQFGKPIGAFQAIKHRCADMALRSELAFAQLLYATIAERDGNAAAAFHGAAAAMLAAAAARESAAASIQVHGGIGFTAEYDAHWLVKRERLIDLLGGGNAGRRARMLAEPFPT